MVETSEVTFLPQPDRDEIRIERVLHALADPVRLHIVRALATSPDGHACGEFALSVSPSTRTHHLRVLRGAGVITTIAAGTRKISSLRRADLDALFPGLLNGVLAAKSEVDELV
ncbi:ArsR/SmtB family transcription factor [Lentzea sp. NPDC059081]|uniref:ArsR/SmtB family transcription factor n=1 Tax=Lentzea sp. NPDC059081 TaxID=3346719 RepID=UPI003673C6EE